MLDLYQLVAQCVDYIYPLPCQWLSDSDSSRIHRLATASQESRMYTWWLARKAFGFLDTLDWTRCASQCDSKLILVQLQVQVTQKNLCHEIKKLPNLRATAVVTLPCDTRCLTSITSESVMDISLVLKVLNYSTLSLTPLRTSIKPSWKWVKTSLQVTFELLFGELKHPASKLHLGTHRQLTIFFQVL